LFLILEQSKWEKLLGTAKMAAPGKILSYRFTRLEEGRTLHSYRTNKCGACALQAKCTISKERCVNRWEHEGVLGVQPFIAAVRG
jgi:hypothetical protein